MISRWIIGEITNDVSLRNHHDDDDDDHDDDETKVRITILQLNDVYVHVLALNMLTRVHKLG